MRFNTIPALLSAMALAVAACGGKEEAPQTANPRQIDLAPTPPAQPQLTDAPATAAPAKAPARKAPAPKQAPAPPPKTETPAAAPVTPVPVPAPVAAAPAAPTTGAVAAGTSMTLKPASKICTNTHQTRDRFTATLANSVQGTNGVVIPPGSAAVFRITESTKKAGGKDSLSLLYELVSVRVGEETYEVQAHQTQNTPLQYVNIQSTTDKASKIGAGAVIGAIAGRVLGGNTKGAVIGGVVGGAAGAAVANNTRDYVGCISETSSIAVALDKPLMVKLAAHP
jgi:hypothetical protein